MAGRGRFVVIEGLDGAGTTTQTELVVARLRNRGVAAEGTSNPSSGVLGSIARAHVRHELTLDERVIAMVFSGDRLDLGLRETEPALEAGTWVVSDRHYLSTLAYQGAKVAGTGTIDLAGAIEWTYHLNRFAVRPDVTFFLEVGREERERRMRATRDRPDRYDEGPDPDLVAAAYRQAIAYLRDRDEIIVEIADGTRPPEVIADEMAADLLERFRR